MIEQGTAEWRQSRLGNITASRLGDLMARTKSGYGASRGNLIASLVLERLTGQPMEGFTSAAMQWGIDTEPLARAAYEAHTGEIVELASYVPHPTIEHSGASPDGYVGEDGLLEIKCPNTSTHLDTLLSKSVPRKYMLQMQWQMECTGRQWCDFVSYDPRMPAHLQMWVTRVERDDEMIAEIRTEVEKALAEITETLTKLENINGV